MAKTIASLVVSRQIAKTVRRMTSSTGRTAEQLQNVASELKTATDSRGYSVKAAFVAIASVATVATSEAYLVRNKLFK